MSEAGRIPGLLCFARRADAIVAAVVGSRVNYWATFVVDGLATGLLLGLATVTGQLGWPGRVAAVTAGVLVWTFFEYLVHRFVFHGRAGAVSRGHLEHHRAPRQPASLPFFVPPLVGLGWWSCVQRLLGGGDACWVVAGSYAGYLAYSVVHHATHATRLQTWPLKVRQRRHLFHHAYRTRNFGVTTDLWDRVFGTLSPPISESPQPRSSGDCLPRQRGRPRAGGLDRERRATR